MSFSRHNAWPASQPRRSFVTLTTNDLSHEQLIEERFVFDCVSLTRTEATTELIDFSRNTQQLSPELEAPTLNTAKEGYSIYSSQLPATHHSFGQIPQSCPCTRVVAISTMESRNLNWRLIFERLLALVPNHPFLQPLLPC